MPKWDSLDDSKIKTLGGRVTRSSKRKEPFDAETRENCELDNPSVKKSKGLIKEKEETFTMKSYDSALLQCLSKSDLTGALKILKGARYDKWCFKAKTLDTALLSASRQGFLFAMQSLVNLGANIEHSDTNGNTALILSVERRSVEMVDFLLSKGANANAVRKSTGDSCLLLAAQPDGFYDIVMLLIENGSDIHWQNKKGDTALIQAFKFGNMGVIHLLLRKGADADLCNKFGKTARSVANSLGFARLLASMSSLKKGVPALVKAVKMKDIQLLELLLLTNVENVDELFWESDVSTTALELAFEKVGFEPLPDPESSKIFETMIKMLLKEGASVNRDTESRNIIDSPLFLAISARRCDLIELLIQYGATGLSDAFEFALLDGNVKCAELLLDKGAEADFKKLAVCLVAAEEVDSARYLHGRCNSEVSIPRLMHRAVCGGHIKVVKVLMELATEFDAKNESYLLHVKDLAMAALLVDHGADMDAVHFSYSRNPELPLTVAIKQNRIDLVKFYLSRGASISHNFGDTGLPVLQCLCDNPSGEILDLLLAEGVDLDYRNKDGESTLIWAVKRKKLSLVKLLIDKGANINLINNGGLSPLMFAVNDDATIEYLISAGAEINRQDHSGNSALIHCAKSRVKGNAKRLKLLLEAGANVNIQNDQQVTALTVLPSYSFKSVKTLLEAGADLNMTDEDGDTPLMNVFDKISMVYRALLQLFLDYGADVNFVRTEEDCEPATSLSIAFSKWILQRGCCYGFTEPNDGSSIIHLLEAGADPSLTPDTKHLLHWAILFNQRPLIPILVTSGLSPFECDYALLRRDFRIPVWGYSEVASGYSGHNYTVSPFRLALSLGRLSIAKFLADISFFTEEDIGLGYSWAYDLQDYLKSKGYLQTAAYVKEFTSVPKSLLDLSSVVISKHLSDRKSIMSVELPRLLQHRLRYLHSRRVLESDIDETSVDEQYRVADEYFQL